jgi:intergrase/recombinase
MYGACEKNRTIPKELCAKLIDSCKKMSKVEKECKMMPKFTTATQPLLNFLVTKEITLPEVARRLNDITKFKKTQGYTLQAIEEEKAVAKKPKKKPNFNPNESQVDMFDRGSTGTIDMI